MNNKKIKQYFGKNGKSLKMEKRTVKVNQNKEKKGKRKLKTRNWIKEQLSMLTNGRNEP